MLPRIKINFENGAIGSVAPSADGVVGLVCTASTVVSGLQLNTTYTLRSIDELQNLGVTPKSDDANAFLYKTVKEFFDEAGAGSELWLMCLPNTYGQSQVLDAENNYAKKLLFDANGRIRVLGVAVRPATESNITNALSEDSYTAIGKAQALAQYMTDIKFAPLVILIEGRAFNGKPAELKDLNEMSNNRVGVLIGDTEANSKGAAIGLLLGRVARVPVQRHIGRVSDGAIMADTLYVGALVPESSDIETIHNKGYIVFRTFVGKSGYFFTDDGLATSVTDDYKFIARRRTVDKAYRIAYNRLLSYVNSEIPLTTTGGIPPAFAKSIEGDVVASVIGEMLPDGNLGVDTSDPTDKGVKCFVDYNQNIAATGRLNVVLQVKPYGYSKYIDVKLGFITINS